MEGGAGIGNLADRFSDLGVSDSSNDSIFQVMKAVEYAESAIKQQLEENNQLRVELLQKSLELEKYRSDARASLRSDNVGLRDENMPGPYKFHLSTSPLGNEVDKARWMDNGSSSVPHGSTPVIHQNGFLKNEDPSLQTNVGSHHYSESKKANGTLNALPGGPASVDTADLSQFSSPSARSLSPSRHQKEGEYDPRPNLAGHGLMQMSEINSSPWKQDLVLKVREHEEEIVQLRRHLVEYSMKEAQIRNEKYVLEKRIAHMRMAFDQQQQDLVDAASKALSYRQDIIEENIRLTYALQAAQQERSTFVSSLLPLLAEYGLQPSVPDAMSIVGNLKVLLKHLQEKLMITEEKLRESQYQLAPWRAEVLNNSSFTPQSPSHPFGAALTTSNKNGLEIVPQPSYSHAQSPISSPSNARTRVDWEALGQQGHQTALTGIATKSLDHDNTGRSSPSVSRNSAVEDVPAHIAVTQSDSHVVRFSEDDPNSSYPYLPPVLEEPSSSFSEAAEDDPLPAIEGLQISGEAFPGRELEAGGYSINGTTSCNFEWVRYLEDGSVNYIDGAKQPKYLVTADDVDSYLAIEVQPLDNRKRKGELFKVLANEQRKITCDPEMQEQIERTLSVGHASFEVSLSAGVLNIWEHAILAIKREGYSIKCNRTRGVVAMEKFSLITAITIPYGHPTEFSIQSASGVEHHLRTTNGSPLRDTIVLTMRLFIMRAGEKRKGRKKGLFFK